MKENVLDSNYLAITALVTIGMQLSFFAVAATFKFDKVTDFAGASNFILLAWLTFGLNGARFDRQVVDTVLVTVWGVRLGIFLLYRVLKRGKDERFDQIRENFFSFLGFWVFQMIWVWTVSLPVIFLNASTTNVAIGARDIAGWVLWGVGFVIEVIADWQKDAFSSEPANRGRVLANGLWRYSRHPNYFGEILVWLGMFISCSAVFEQNVEGAYVSVLSPVLTAVLLLFLSGIPPAEKRYDERYGHMPFYREYKERTSPLFPLPPDLYRPLPQCIKQYLLLELPLYNYLDRPGQA